MLEVMKNIILIIAIFTVSFSFSQREKTLTIDEETNMVNVVYYYDNGGVRQTGSFSVDGELEGEWVSYDEAGQVEIKAFYKHGEKVGVWIHIIEGIPVEVDYSKDNTSL